MKSQFFILPDEETVIKESADIFKGCPLISFDMADIRLIAKDASNIFLLEGYANSSCSISDAIDDAIAKASAVARNFDLFSANKILVQLSFSKNKPIHISSLSELFRLVDMFQPDTCVKWGLLFDKSINDDTVIARLIAANIKLNTTKKQNYGNKKID